MFSRKIQREFLGRQGLFSECLTSAGHPLARDFSKNGLNNLLPIEMVSIILFNIYEEINMRLSIVEFLYLNDHVRKDIQMVHLKAVI
jgi:hypothetical protein